MPNSHRNQTWLSLGSAARRLGVHPTTLRRWARNGDIPFRVTPGGHRRFSLEEIEQLSSTTPAGSNGNDNDDGAGQRRLSRQDERTAAADAASSVAGNRQDGAVDPIERQLVNLATRVLDRPYDEPTLLAEARALGQQHAETALHQQRSLSEVTRTTLVFRDRVVDVVLGPPGETESYQPPTAAQLRRLTTMLDAVQVSISATYQQRLDL